MILTRAVIALTLALAHGVQGQCGWNLIQNDCICMKSTDGSLMGPETATCCRDMGLKTTNSKCNVGDEDRRQTFKDCCKWLKEESVIGHCR